MSSSSSSSAPTMNKPTNLSQIQQTMLTKPNYSSSPSCSSSSTVKSLISRKATIFKKAFELSVLCGIKVCVIFYGPDGELKTWPEDKEKVEDLARRYIVSDKTKRYKKSVDLHKFLRKINHDGSKKKKEVKRRSKVKYPVWDPKFDNYSVDQLKELYQSLERNQTRIQHRLGAVFESQEQRKIQNMNMANQELMMTTTLNHLQQQPNKVSVYLSNHGDGTLSQIPVSTTALNQGQSLPPIPISLTNYPNWNVNYPNLNVGNYLGSSVGVQETGINGSQNMNMITYNNNSFNDFSQQIDQNPIMESYSGLLGVQQSGINVLENIQNPLMESYSDLLGVQQSVLNELENIQNPLMESYSGLLGVQQSGINELQNIQNPLMESYYGLLGVQQSGVNELQNIQNPLMESYYGLLGVQQSGVNELENIGLGHRQQSLETFSGVRLNHF